MAAAAHSDEEVVAMHPAATAPQGRALTARQLICVGLCVLLADLTLFRGEGFAGIAVMAVAATALLWLGKSGMPGRWILGSDDPSGECGSLSYGWIVTALLMAAALKLAWGGSIALAVFGGLLLVALAVALERRPPFVVHVLSVAVQAIPAGVLALVGHRQDAIHSTGSSRRQRNWLGLFLPLAVVAIFGGIFVMANPDLAESVRALGERGWRQLATALRTFSIGELLFWLLVALLTLGLLRPLNPLYWSPLAALPEASSTAGEPSDAQRIAYRNSLIAAIVLFAVYLVFEFMTLWFRDFPEGFYYAGYAHQGAAWLTIALALTTVFLSVMFPGSTAASSRLAQLRPLAWVWSAENLILAAAVYNRLWIYVQFNGMTRMRTVGLLGITAVVIGLLLMMRRLARGHGFLWLAQRYAWTVSMAALVYLLLPVDMLVHAYNVRRVLAGDLPPVVQIVAHPIDSGGMLVLPALIDSDNPIIRDGIRAMLAERQARIGTRVRNQREAGWSAFQLSDAWLQRHLNQLQPHWAELVDEPERRQPLLDRFTKFAMQWY